MIITSNRSSLNALYQPIALEGTYPLQGIKMICAGRNKDKKCVKDKGKRDMVKSNSNVNSNRHSLSDAEKSIR
jgi:hypothetical protein